MWQPAQQFSLLQVGWGKGVQAGGVPDKELSLLHYSHPECHIQLVKLTWMAADAAGNTGIVVRVKLVK